jgi:hypothetical protein
MIFVCQEVVHDGLKGGYLVAGGFLVLQDARDARCWRSCMGECGHHGGSGLDIASYELCTYNVSLMADFWACGFDSERREACI